MLQKWLSRTRINCWKYKAEGDQQIFVKSFRYPINDDHWKAVIIARLPRVIIVKTLSKIDGHRLLRYGPSRLFMGIFDFHE